MKSIYLTLLFLLLICVNVEAQTYTIQYQRIPNIEYQLRNQNDPAIRERVTAYLRSNVHHYQLIHSNEKSTYLPVKKSKIDGTISKMNTTDLNSYFKNLADRSYKINSKIQGRLFIVEDTLKKQEWIIHDEYKNILGHHCRKATTSVEGKMITAFFTNEIAIGNGPRLFGIENAAILELDVNSSIIQAVEIQLKEETTLIEVFFEGLKVDQTEYDKNVNELKLDFQLQGIKKN